MELKPHPVTGFLCNIDGTVIINPHTGKQLNPTLSRAGYMVVGNYVGSGRVHRLVYECWIGLIPEGLQINHKDGVKTNNHISNLETVTARENTVHAYTTGLATGKKGEDNSMASVTEAEVVEMYDMMKRGYNNKEIGDKYNLHDRYVSLIRHGKRWKYLYKEPLPKSFNFVYPRSEINNAIEMLEQGIPNIEISQATGIEVSNISRLRHGKIWNEYVEFYKAGRNDYPVRE